MRTDSHLAVPTKDMHAPPGPPPSTCQGCHGPSGGRRPRKGRAEGGLEPQLQFRKPLQKLPTAPSSLPSSARQSSHSQRAPSLVSGGQQAVASAFPTSTPSFPTNALLAKPGLLPQAPRPLLLLLHFANCHLTTLHGVHTVRRSRPDPNMCHGAPRPSVHTTAAHWDTEREAAPCPRGLGPHWHGGTLVSRRLCEALAEGR